MALLRAKMFHLDTAIVAPSRETRKLVVGAGGQRNSARAVGYHAGRF